MLCRSPDKMKHVKSIKPWQPHVVATYRRRIVKLLIAHDHMADVEPWLQELKRVQFAVSAEVVQTSETFSARLREPGV